MTIAKRALPLVLSCLATLALSASCIETALDDRVVALFTPTDWRVDVGEELPGQPFDIEAFATFTHAESGETLRTRWFYDGASGFVLRFTGTRSGTWTIATSSALAALDGHVATVTVEDDLSARGFVSGFGNKWGWSHSGDAFVPNYLMWHAPSGFADDPPSIDTAITTFLGEHGFNGLHVLVLNEWYELGARGPEDHDSTDPDPRTFEALEQLIERTYAAGGVVHLWFTGDCENDACSRFGPGSEEEARLLRYIGARLAPLPGWTMGYGFDITEDHLPSDVEAWHADLHAEMAWPHMLGARTESDFEVNGLHRTSGTSLCSTCDYESWVDHRPDAALYAELIDRNENKPCFLEDRFRIRPLTANDPFQRKGYDIDDTRRGLWHATMAGGAAGIWGNLVDAPAQNVSAPYPAPEELATYQRFWDTRFSANMRRCERASDATCLRDWFGFRWVFYGEDTTSIAMDLRWMPRWLRAVAVDTRAPYEEINLGLHRPAQHVFEAPYASDWAIAVGPFTSQ